MPRKKNTSSFSLSSHSLPRIWPTLRPGSAANIRKAPAPDVLRAELLPELAPSVTAAGSRLRRTGRAGGRLCGRAGHRGRAWRWRCWAIFGPRAPWRTRFSAPCYSSPGPSTCGRPCLPGGRSDPSLPALAGRAPSSLGPPPCAAPSGASFWGCRVPLGTRSGDGRLGF